MVLISNGHDATLLQLQYVAESVGLRRDYVAEKEPAEANEASDSDVQHADLIRPIPVRDIIAERPDIEWHPSFSTYQARVARLAQSADSRPTELPEAFPAQIKSPRAWTGSDFADPELFLVRLSTEDIEELRAALAHFKRLDGDLGPDAVSKSTFPLPNLETKLVSMARNVHLGTGFNVLRGIDPTEFSPLDNVLIYLGLTSYIADIRGVQDYDGRMIVHIKDIEKDLPEATGRPSPYTSRAQPFHTDMCDILSMYVVDTALLGGESLLASSAMVYNEIATSRPDIIHQLAGNDWIHDEFNRRTASWFNRPLLYNFKRHGPGFFYSRRPLTGAPFCPHVPGVPAMTEAQAEAIDAVQFIAAKHQLAITLQPGDVEIFNNKALLHARNGFVDVADHNTCHEPKSTVNHTRHMLRLWLKSSDPDLTWDTPDPLISTSSNIYDDSESMRAGKWDIHRVPPINRVLEKHFTCS